MPVMRSLTHSRMGKMHLLQILCRGLKYCAGAQPSPSAAAPPPPGGPGARGRSRYKMGKYNHEVHFSWEWNEQCGVTARGAEVPLGLGGGESVPTHPLRGGGLGDPDFWGVNLGSKKFFGVSLKMQGTPENPPALLCFPKDHEHR